MTLRYFIYISFHFIYGMEFILFIIVKIFTLYSKFIVIIRYFVPNHLYFIWEEMKGGPKILYTYFQKKFLMRFYGTYTHKIHAHTSFAFLLLPRSTFFYFHCRFNIAKAEMAIAWIAHTNFFSIIFFFFTHTLTKL